MEELEHALPVRGAEVRRGERLDDDLHDRLQDGRQDEPDDETEGDGPQRAHGRLREERLADDHHQPATKKKSARTTKIVSRSWTSPGRTGARAGGTA